MQYSPAGKQSKPLENILNKNYARSAQSTRLALGSDLATPTYNEADAKKAVMKT